MEPKNIRRWRHRSEQYRGELLTCARPGRSTGRHVLTISDSIVHQWVKGLPRTTNLAIVSLLGRKNGPTGRSEFAFYSFCGGFDTPSERKGRVTFQQWLNRYYPVRQFELIEHPTYDGLNVPEDTLIAINADIRKLLSAGRTVILLDSGGIQRTSAVCDYMRFVERFGS